jgi:hypothetical protein
MAQFTLYSTERKNSKVILLHSGETSFNEQGVAVVELESEAQLQDMLNCYTDLQEVPTGEPLKNQTNENELGKSKDEDNDLGGNQEDPNDITGSTASNDEVAAQLDALSLPDLKQLATDSGFPAEEWATLKKAELKTYLASKLQPQA